MISIQDGNRERERVRFITAVVPVFPVAPTWTSLLGFINLNVYNSHISPGLVIALRNGPQADGFIANTRTQAHSYQPSKNALQRR